MRLTQLSHRLCAEPSPLPLKGNRIIGRVSLRHTVLLVHSLAACLATLAGALGSNFDSDDEIRQATYSKREHERRQRRDQNSLGAWESSRQWPRSRC